MAYQADEPVAEVLTSEQHKDDKHNNQSHLAQCLCGGAKDIRQRPQPRRLSLFNDHRNRMLAGLGPLCQTAFGAHVLGHAGSDLKVVDHPSKSDPNRILAHGIHSINLLFDVAGVVRQLRRESHDLASHQPAEAEHKCRA